MDSKVDRELVKSDYDQIFHLSKNGQFEVLDFENAIKNYTVYVIAKNDKGVIS